MSNLRKFSWKMFATQLVSRFASRTAATATVRAVKRRSLIPTRAALTLVSHTLKNYKYDISVKNEKKIQFQTPSAVKRVKELLGNQQNSVSFFFIQSKNCNLTKNRTNFFKIENWQILSWNYFCYFLKSKQTLHFENFVYRLDWKLVLKPEAVTASATL